MDSFGYKHAIPFYSILGLGNDASACAICTAYKKLAMLQKLQTMGKLLAKGNKSMTRCYLARVAALLGLKGNRNPSSASIKTFNKILADKVLLEIVDIEDAHSIDPTEKDSINLHVNQRVFEEYDKNLQVFEGQPLQQLEINLKSNPMEEDSESLRTCARPGVAIFIP